jgi:hypothetical protein
MIASAARGGFSGGLFGGGQQGWVGGGLSIVSEGLDAKGDINLGLVGNCPRCGLLFGGVGLPEGGMVEVVNPNTQQTVSVDPTSPEGMATVSRMSAGAKARRGKEQTKLLDPRLGKILEQVSEAFPGKRVKIFRGATGVGGKGEHAKGTAMDIGVEGVKSEDLFKFVMANVKGGGKGFYPERPFVHVDVRPGKAHWVDPSKKGEKGGKVIGGPEALSWFKEKYGGEGSTVKKSKPKASKVGAGGGALAEGEFAGEGTEWGALPVSEG